MTWFKEEDNKTWIEKQCACILKEGSVPKHVAFIMDGNRRFATKLQLDKIQGHFMGFEKLTETLDWCRELGVEEVTVYAFSIENFKRSKEEVDSLLELARKKFKSLLEEREMIEKHGVCVRVFGDISMLPQDIQSLIAEAMLISRHNSNAYLNVCLAYTSRHEICHAVKTLVKGVQDKLIETSDIDEELLGACLYTGESKWPEPHVLMRTSGEVRLSDFLLWQGSYSFLSFVKVLWPEFSIWHLFAAVLQYQMNEPTILAAKEDRSKRLAENLLESALQQVSKQLNISNGAIDNKELKMQAENYQRQRQERINAFIEHVRQERWTELERLCTNFRNVSER